MSEARTRDTGSIDTGPIETGASETGASTSGQVSWKIDQARHSRVRSPLSSR